MGDRELTIESTLKGERRIQSHAGMADEGTLLIEYKYKHKPII